MDIPSIIKYGLMLLAVILTFGIAAIVGLTTYYVCKGVSVVASILKSVSEDIVGEARVTARQNK